MIAAPHPFQIMAKPIGPRCNLDCTYCYYLEKERLYPETKRFTMSEAVLEAFVKNHIASQSIFGLPEIEFVWQGGEPTMLGIDFFRKAVAFQKEYVPSGTLIKNSLQTNGTLLDAEWARFFKDNGFLIGFSIDGPQDLHDAYRVDRAERGSFAKVMAGLEHLQAHGVDYNTLTVVNRRNSQAAREVYRFLKKIGSRYMQFIPLVERSADGETLAGAPQIDEDGVEYKVTPWSVLPRTYGDFLCAIFDDWIAADVGEVFVQFFEVQLGLWLGQPARLCWYAETCGNALVIEHNGDLYACDHYVYPQFRLGNVMDTPAAILANSAEQKRFGEAKRETLPRQCRECEYRFACHGACPKQRFLKTSDGEPGLSYYCRSHLRFFRHAAPKLRAMAELYRQGRPIADIMATPASGRKA
ncbi:anaerobic sulfatase maturase [Consotaella aegiceratis]|uniref:anaerobic sulfatase maturase n=1 Tax=Consotaella aegiceratis TaxID=3097961 RepID=UPI002F4095C9